MNSTIKILLKPIIWLRNKRDSYLKQHNPARLFSLRYSRVFGQQLDYLHPQSLYDKIGYMAFYTDTSLWTKLADKVKVRDYVVEKGLSQMLTRLYGVYDTSSEIDFDSLPKSFVLKTNNGSATNIIVKDKNKLVRKAVCDKLDYWIKFDYGRDTCQPHYSRIPPKILAEEFLEDNVGKGNYLVDYKFFCVDGNPLFVQVMTERIPNTHNMKVMVFDMDWNSHPEYCSAVHQLADSNIPKPISFSEMVNAAKVLSAGIPFVRVDLYEINNKPVFGEMTFTPGFSTITISFLNMLGRKLILNHNVHKHK